jgi:hypothetical protein
MVPPTVYKDLNRPFKSDELQTRVLHREFENA